jgi:hypothetical protein
MRDITFDLEQKTIREARMKVRINKFLAVCVLFITMSAMFLPGCAQAPVIKTKLTFSEPPVLGKQVELTATFILANMVYPKADVKAEIVLPKGMEKVGEDLQFQGVISPGQTYEIKTTVKALKIGLWEVKAKSKFG